MDDIIKDIRALAEDGAAQAKDRWEHMRWTAVIAAVDRATQGDAADVTQSDGDRG
jgi:hypothetical protein